MAKKKIDIFIEIHNEKEFENVIKGNPGQLICAEVFSNFAGSCSALDRLFTIIKLDWSSGKMIMLKVPADEIEVLQRFRNQSEPVFLFILNERVTKMFRGVDAIKIAEIAKKELYYFKMEEAGSVTDRPTYNLDEPTPDEKGWLSVRAAEKKQESSNLEYRRATRQAARKRHRAELMVPHLQNLNFVLFWPHTTHAHPELYGRWDMNNIVMVGREVLQLTKEKADDILYAGDAPVNEASMHKLLSAPALAICFRILDTDKHFVSLVRSILYEPPPIDEDKPMNEQLPRKPAFDRYKTFSPTREQVWQMRREAKIKRRQEEIERRARRLSEMQRMARQAQAEAIEARTREKEQKKLELLKAGNLSALDQLADEPDEEIDIVIPEELPEAMEEESSEEEDENEYMPPAGLLIPGFYAPPNDIAKANGLAILFPNQVLDCVVPQDEFLPPHVLVMLSIPQRHAAIDVMRKRQYAIIHMGIFRAPTPFNAVHIAYSVHQFDSMNEHLTDVEVKLAFMLSVKVDVPLLELMDLGPQHVSRDRTSGEDECAALFPVDYADSYPQFEDFGDMTILNPKEDTS